MGGDQCRGAMTVFFSILTVLFLSLACALADAARIQGAKIKAQTLLEMGMFSLFGEYERELLESYQVFGLDAGREQGGFLSEHLEKTLNGYLNENLAPGKRVLGGGRTLFPISTEGSRIEGYLLLTDQNGEVFQSQVVQNLKNALGTEVAAGYLEARKKAQEMEEAGKNYEKQEERTQSDLEKAEREAEEAANEAETGEGDVVVVEPGQEEREDKPDNPLELIRKIKNMGILGIVMENPEDLSSKAVEGGELPSFRDLEKGTIDASSSKGGILEEGIFQEYLFEHFASAVDQEPESPLSYELEYLLCGKSSDEANLKAVVHKLLLLREGSNFLYVLSNGEMRHSAELLAASLSGGIPGITAALTGALLAAWAYGESLLDVRILLAGGKVPTVKGPGSFRLTLENLGRLLEVLQESGRGQGEGLDYRAYLQLLFLTGKRTAYPMRTLDLIEGRMKKMKNLASFRADHCVVGLEAKADWELYLVYSDIPTAFLGTSGETVTYHTEGSFQYGGF